MQKSFGSVPAASLQLRAYAQLREGKSLDSDKDLSDYLMKVLIIREKLNISKWGATKPLKLVPCRALA